VILVARPSSADVETRVMTLRSTVEGVTANLVELDADVTRQLLDASAGLTGKTAAAWADASKRLTRLWEGQLALQQVLDRIDTLRAGRRSLPPRVLQAVCDVLEGPSVELPAPSGQGRRLTDTAPPTEGWTIEAALDSLSDDYDAVIGVVTAVGRVWGESTEHRATLAAELSEMGRMARELDVGLSTELAAMRRALDAAETSARTDPVGFDATVVEAMFEQVRQVRRVIDDARQQRASVARDFEAFDTAVARASVLLEECRKGLGRLEAKVVVPPSQWDVLDHTGRELEVLRAKGELARRSTDARSLGSLRTRVDVLVQGLRHVAEFTGSGLARRDELRGLLDAYLAKAQAMGVEERPEVDDAHGQLREMLYSAPCDLDAAEVLFTDYRHTIARAAKGHP
jgi:hypothetical protein